MIETISYFSAALAVLVILANIITQVVKGFTYDKIPTRIVAVIVAMVLSIIAMVVWCLIHSVGIVWYYIAGAIIISFIVAYCAMYGYDNLYGEFVQAFKNLIGGGNNG